mmetsp:Transcript_34309/g.39639  ORF Transcript_34309/g.39639 Transcript_34309/m.39639 type:complete len:103 (-) Transcript_34309:87-395(-)
MEVDESSAQVKAESASNPPPVKIKFKAEKDFYRIIEKILMAGNSRLSKEMIDGLMEMLTSFNSDNNQAVDQEITTVKFFRLVMFNTTFYLGKYDSDNNVFIK